MVASDTGTLALVASSYSISAVTCRSPLANRIQPSAMRCLVGRSPTERNIDFTSCHGQPFRSVRAGASRGGKTEGLSGPVVMGRKIAILRRLPVLGTAAPAHLLFDCCVCNHIRLGLQHATAL